jgi:hypothetical protein
VDSNDQVVADLSKVPREQFRVGATVEHDTDYRGWIDDLRLYDYAKSAKEIEALYRGGDLALAWKPDPFDGKPDIARDLAELTWKAGDYATSHDVYFGTDLEAVTDANTTVTFDVYKGNQPLADTNFAVPSQLELDRTYYWRIDEVNEANECSPWTGRVWRFKVANYLIVDDFESYGLLSSPVYDTWLSGTRYVPYPPWYIYVNGSITSLAVSYAQPPDPVHRGKQALILDYLNDGWEGKVRYYSETECGFDPPQDWTEADVKVLTLFFYGDPNNDANETEQMYATVRSGDVNGTVEYGYYVDEDMNDIKEDEWQGVAGVEYRAVGLRGCGHEQCGEGVYWIR